ncbi:MAG: riboflavin synthase [Erysipelothrix sp.]|nr:riboflavin synthase [Erysipelothrix sp.]
MFTGIVETVGSVKSIRRKDKAIELFIDSALICEDLKLGDSISVNGVCLTATSITKPQFSVDVIHETIRSSSLNKLTSNSKVNLERAMPMNGRFGGHIVSGHVDGVGTIRKILNDGNSIIYTIEAPENVMRYTIDKGSITIDGISLTVASVSERSFQVAIIPFTASETTLSLRKVGDTVNLESDLVGKFIEKMVNNTTR